MKDSCGYFKDVEALSAYRLRVDTGTGASIEFDFSSRLDTMRFGALKDPGLFSTARTDGSFILFGDAATRVSISADDFMDLLLVDRTRTAGEDGGK